MRALVALGLARHVVLGSASDSSVSSALAGFQRFTDGMVAKYGQTPDELAASGDSNAIVDGSQDTVTQVAGAGGEDHVAGVTSEDEVQIKNVIGWLQDLKETTLRPAHRDDDNLQGDCQKRLDICEAMPAIDNTPCENSGAMTKHADYVDMDVGILRHYEIGSETQGTTKAQIQVGHTKSVLSPNGDEVLINRNLETDLLKQPTSGGTGSRTPISVPAYFSAQNEQEDALHGNLVKKVDPAHYVAGEQVSDGIGVYAGYFTNGDPPAKAMIDADSRTEVNCPYMTDITTLTLDNPQVVVTSGTIKGTQEFNADTTSHDYCKCGSLYTAKTEFGLRHKACREHHQEPACYNQQVKCEAYDDYRKNDDNRYPICAEDSASNEGGDLKDEYISMEWWFKERKEMENCLASSTSWFTPLWDSYMLCDQAIKNCAEATLTCDNIQLEFENKHCEWDAARKQACDDHKECYELEIKRCANSCDLIKKRVTGRKAENEIIERIICMLRSLLANNDEHFDSGNNTLAGGASSKDFTGAGTNLDNSVSAGGTGSFRKAADMNSDSGSKASRLQDCKSLVVDSTEFNLVCQGPKKRESPCLSGVCGKFLDGDNEADYRPWTRASGGEFPRLNMDMNTKLAGTEFMHLYTETIKVDQEDWKGNADEKVGDGFGNLEIPYHRVTKEYTPWGFDCDFTVRPCTHKFVAENYNFMRDANDHMERAPCTKCDTNFAGDEAWESSDVCSTGQSHTSCACFHSRDASFCTTCATNCGACTSYCGNHPDTLADPEKWIPEHPQGSLDDGDTGCRDLTYWVNMEQHPPSNELCADGLVCTGYQHLPEILGACVCVAEDCK